jgi:hypothetical protein
MRPANGRAKALILHGYCMACAGGMPRPVAQKRRPPPPHWSRPGAYGIIATQ